MGFILSAAVRGLQRAGRKAADIAPCCWAAILVRSAIAETQRDRRAFARACGLDEEALERIAAGRERPSTAELAAMLTRASSGLRVRIEVYDGHDDGLHLSAQADPELHRPRRQASASTGVSARA